jgi:glycosyltransferase involved in cell wall biosynthesis
MRLDIMVPYWGDPAFMKETVNSVLAQDCPDWRLTVIDDAYPDPEIGRWMAELNDPRITYLRNEKNAGVVNNYRKCRDLATGELMMFMGCDDVLMPNYVSAVLKAHAAHPDAAVIQPGTNMIDEAGRLTVPLADIVKKYVVMPKPGQRRAVQGEYLATSLLDGNWMYWPALAFRSDKIRATDFDDNLKFTHDLAFVLDLVFAGEQMLLDSTVCFTYRRHSSSASAASLFDGRRFADEIRCFNRAQAQAEALGWSKAARASRWRWTSRAHAVVLAFQAVFTGRAKFVPHLLAHVVAR